MMPTRTPILLTPDAQAPRVIDLSAADGLSPRGRRTAWALTLVLLVIGLMTLSAWAGPQLTGTHPGGGAAPVGAGAAHGSPADPAQPAGAPGAVLDGAIQAHWDGPTTHLDWRGGTYVTAEASFVGDRVASPGDRVQRTLRIGNAGPADAVMTVGLVLDRTTPETVTAGDLSEAIDLFWDVAGVDGQERFSTLLAADQQPVVSQVAVPRGATVPVTVGFAMPAEVTGYADAASSGVVEFQVVVRLQGDTTPAQVPALAITGTQVLGLVALALGLAGLGWLLLALARRRHAACDDCGTRLRGDDTWSAHQHADGTRRVQCGTCHAVPGADVGARSGGARA